MCLYPRLIQNKKYTETKKNRGVIPPVLDNRVLYVPKACHNCIECRKQKAREWQSRLLEEIKHHTNGHMVTLTFSDESINKLMDYEKEFTDKKTKLKYKLPLRLLQGYELDNEIATVAIRLFNERWRKKFKKALRHWFVTELGHKGTKNIHLHGIIWTDHDIKHLREIWNYGFVWDGYNKNGKRINYVNDKTVNYSIKYVSKIDKEHKQYKSLVLTSPGIGNQYTSSYNSRLNKFNNADTNDTYKSRTGHTLSLPIYWRNKIYNDDEREALWLHKLDKQERWVCGEKVDVSKTLQHYYTLLDYHRKRSDQLGYGNDKINWNRYKYEHETRKIMQQTRVKRAQTKQGRCP